MISRRKLKANRRNAKRSTGPKSARGKETASRNAVRHGLASRPDLEMQRVINAIVDALCEPDASFSERNQAQTIAEAQVQLSQVRAARAAVLGRIQSAPSVLEMHRHLWRSIVGRLPSEMQSGQVEELARDVGKMARLLQGLGKAIEPSNEDELGVGTETSGAAKRASIFTSIQQEWLAAEFRELERFERYERRALSRRRRAMEVLDAFRNSRRGGILKKASYACSSQNEATGARSTPE